MRVSKKFLLGGVVATTAALVLTACAPTGTEPTTPTELTEVTVGVITSESGALSGYGAQYLDGFKAGLDYVTGGTGIVDNIKINIEYRDDAGDADTAVNAAKELIGNGVKVLMGSASSGVALQLAAQAEQNQVLFISGPAATDALTGINKYTFRSGRQSMQDVATAGGFLENVSGSKIVVFGQDNAFGQGNVAAVQAVLGSRGATVDQLLVAEDVTEFTTQARQVAASGADLVFVAWAGATTAAMWEAMTQQNVFSTMPVVTGLGDRVSYNAYGVASEGISFLNHYFEGGPSNAVNDAMVAAVGAGKADLFTPDGFNAAIMLVQALKGSTTDVNAMISALEGFSFDGPKGKTTVRAADHALLQEMYQVKLVKQADGTFMPERVSTSPADSVAP